MKFRAWHKIAKKFAKTDCHFSNGKWDTGENQNYGDLAITMDGELVYDDMGNGQYSVQDQHNYIIDMFTGMLDCDGKEIYENDIVKYSRMYGREDISEIVRWKRFEHGYDYTFFETWCIGEYTLLSVLEYAGHRHNDDYNSLCDIKPNSLKVIGNIYEPK